MAKERAKKKSFQESLEEIKDKMKDKRTKRLASVSAPNRGRSRMITKCNGTSSTNTILIGVQQNNKALAVALQAEKERVRQANAVILQLKREQQALFLHLLLLKKKLKDQEALAANSSGNSLNNIVSTTTESQRKKHNNKSVVETPPQKGSPLCQEDKPVKLPPTVGVRRRQTDRSSSSRRRSDHLQEHNMGREDPGAGLETLPASPICSDDTNHKQTHHSEEPVIEEPDEEFQHSTPEPAPAKSTKQPQPGRKQQARTKAEVKKPDRGRKVERGPLKKPWENLKPRARSKSRDRSATRSKTAPAPQNKLNTSLGFNDTFDFDCEEAVHVTPFKAKTEDEEPETAVCKEPPEESPVVSRGKDSLSPPSSESEDSLYVPQKSKKKQASPENIKVMNTRRGRHSKRVNNENVPPHKEFSVFRDEDSSPKVERSNKKEMQEWKSPEQETVYEGNQTDPHEADLEERCLPPVSPLVEAEIKRIDDVLSTFGESSNDNSPLLADQMPQRAKSCKKRGLVVRPAGRGLSLCDVTNLSPAAWKFQRGGSRLSEVRCSTPAQGPARKRRCTMTVDYKEPSLSAKLRRGDKFTDVEFLRSPIFKQKSGRRSVQKSRSSMKMQQPFGKYNESFVGCR